MKASNFSDAQKAFILKQGNVGVPAAASAGRPGSARRPISIGRRSMTGCVCEVGKEPNNGPTIPKPDRGLIRSFVAVVMDGGPATVCGAKALAAFDQLDELLPWNWRKPMPSAREAA
jgi:hypothetical protein